MQLQREQRRGDRPVAPTEPGREAPLLTTLEADAAPSIQLHTTLSRREQLAQASFIWPAIGVVLVLSIFPLLVSLYLSLSYLEFVPGGFNIRFVGLDNYRALITGLDHIHFLGLLKPPALVGWVIFGAGIGLLAVWLIATIRGRKAGITGLLGRVVVAVVVAVGLWLMVQSLAPGGRPGTLEVTLIYVFVGITLQYGLGLGLALLTTQPLPGRRFFRVIFLLPMMITPVGVAYLFEMLTDTSKGPLQPLWKLLGLTNFSWVNDPWGARAAVIIGDVWQWTPFMFIVLLAALEGQQVEPMEAALVDGASRWQIFRHLTWPALLPVSSTLILIRLIEGMKIIDLPNILTNGGPGTATESMTLHAYISWRTLDLGGSAAVAYSLLFVVTFLGVSYVNLIRPRVTEAT
jgi:multiple sugar transport system permease protein